MILHINKYALHGLISHKDHSNVNHIQSSILLNMCIKPLLPSQVLKDIIQICKPSLLEVTERPIGQMLTGCGMFPGEIKSKSCLVGEVVKGCLDKGCNDSREMHGLPVGVSVEGELHLSLVQMFPSPFMPFILYSLLLFLSRS
jgi:hypothetical protein